MNTEDIRRTQDELGITAEELGRAAGVSVAEVRAWERRGTVPRRVASKVKLGLWELRRARALEAAQVPPCPWVQSFSDWRDPKRVAELERHMDGCDVCRRRQTVLSAVGPPPITGGPFDRALAYDEHLSGWRRDAFRGALLIVGMGGIGALVLLARAVLDRSLFTAGLALALVAIMAASGAIGGLVHYWTRGWRNRGAVGHYVSGVVTVYGYLVSVSGMIMALVWLLGYEFGSVAIEEGAAAAYAVSFAVVGLIFGIVFGRMTRDRAGARASNSR